MLYVFFFSSRRRHTRSLCDWSSDVYSSDLVQSDIPIGCGMGSSSATILSVMHAVSTYLKIQISPETLYQLALEAENMQHGHSSGFDLRVAQLGGCIYMHNQQIETRAAPAMP